MDVFCKIVNDEIPSYRVYEDSDVMCIMDATPVHIGHVLIIPKKHYTDITELDDDIVLKINNVRKKVIAKMEEVLTPLSLKGIKVVVNYLDEQDVKHYHMHIIPFYMIDPNMDKEEMCNLLKI